MAVTKSTAAERRTSARTKVGASNPRRFEFLALLGVSFLIAFGLALVYNAKTDKTPTSVNLIAVKQKDQLLPALEFLPSASDRDLVATRIFAYLHEAGDRLPNVGALARLRVPVNDVVRNSRLVGLNSRVADARRSDNTLPLLTSSEFSHFKRAAVVRTPTEFRRLFLLWCAAFFFIFYALHSSWQIRGFTGNEIILPILHALTGTGLILLTSLRDPLRDTLAFRDFSQSVCLAVLVTGVLVWVDFERVFAKLSYVPLLGAFVLSVALILFGSGPGSSDVKVNLFGFQPVELIKILIVFFLAGYFAQRWEFLRVLKERRKELQPLANFVEIPRLEFLLPLLVAVGLTLVFFFLQKDLGPALIIACVFLAMYAVARNRVVLAIGGLALMLGGFLAGYALGFPRTVHDRVSMWLSPWDNAVRGGEQVVHSLWAFSTGGAWGTGLGLGDASLMPAAHTDLILAVLGEEWGFAGFVIVFLLYAALISTGLLIAIRARTDYGFFLALGLTLLLALGAILISGGVLDLTPLSGVVTPFLSYGGTAMIANFAICAILLSLSRTSALANSSEPITQPFALPFLRLSQTVGVVLLVIVGKAAWIQVIRPNETVGAGTLTLQGDGVRRYLYNPRLLAIAESIPRGVIYDRNGLPLAASDWSDLEKHKSIYTQMKIDLDTTVNRADSRHYPFGGSMVHLLGDLRSRANWGAANSSLIERDSMVRLQGYDDHASVVEVPDERTGKSTFTIRHDYRELVPLLRHKHQPDHPDVVRVRNRERDVRTTIDARLQVRTAVLLKSLLMSLKRDKGAVIVLDPVTGDLLASVSYPFPVTLPPPLAGDGTVDDQFDRARYGLYPPGSTFKIVTAMAALRKDPANADATYECRALGDGRVGNSVRGWGRPIRDDVADHIPHGTVDLAKGFVVSCNAYFAQLGTYRTGPEALRETADKLGIRVANPNTAARLKDALPQASYGQGQVVASPFQMARVAATIAQGGMFPLGRWISDASNARTEPPVRVLPAALAATIAQDMRLAVTSGTGRLAAGANAAIAGKTGTAELEDQASHAWFIGFAPYGGPRKIAFAVLVENGRYGGSAAAPIAAGVVNIAAELGLFAPKKGSPE